MAAEVEETPPWRRIIWYPILKTTPHLFLYKDLSDGEWEHSFSENETQLQVLREKINLYERDSGESKWEYFKKVVNPYELIYTQKKYQSFPDSVCLLHPLSRSYFKMREILTLSGFFVDFAKVVKLRSAHACEGPGGFIEGFFDECTNRRIIPTQATAMTLRPKQANVPGWRRAATFLQRHRNIKIVYGPDNTGNLLNYDNQNDFIAACDTRVQLYTGDGGFDFSTNYDSQEKAIFPLLIASVRVGFEVLAEDGHFVLKFFDMYHAGTKDLIYFLSQHFRTWTIYKPATSRPCNPEQYFIGRGFRVPTADTLTQIRAWSKAICDGHIPSRLLSTSTEAVADVSPVFVEIMQNVIRECVLHQINYLQKVFQLIENNTLTDTDIIGILRYHEVQSYKWCREFNVPIYPDRCRSIEALQSGRQLLADHYRCLVLRDTTR